MYGLKPVPFTEASFSAACKARTLPPGAGFPQSLALLRGALGGQELLEGRNPAQAGELTVGNDLPGIGESLVERHAQVLDGAVVQAGADTTLGHVVIHGAALLKGGRVFAPRAGAVVKDMRVDGQGGLVDLPALLVLVLAQQVGAELFQNQGGAGFIPERLAVHALGFAVLLERVVDGAQVVEDTGAFGIELQGGLVTAGGVFQVED